MSEIAAYVRVSTQKQLNEDSHERQRERVREWADRNGYDPDEDVEIYEDLAVSGQADDRDAYQDLMDSYEEYQAVVVRELSRFGRDPIVVMQDVEEILDSETDFVSITEPFDSTDAIGKAMMRMVAVFNGMYADLKREQAIAAAERRKEQGKNVGRKKKLSNTERAKVREWRESGLSYNAIATLVAEQPDFDADEISARTVKRYCDEMDTSA